MFWGGHASHSFLSIYPPLQQLLPSPATSPEPPCPSSPQNLCLRLVPILFLSFMLSLLQPFRAQPGIWGQNIGDLAPTWKRFGGEELDPVALRGNLLRCPQLTLPCICSWRQKYGPRVCRTVNTLWYFLGTLDLDSTKVNWIYFLQEFI